mmetsp:Transcript_184652/g.585685  ORF Transcript_184652/g.585685 Transcript_184652/m.585685 type:complete len:93 (-) Transcript_184652:73-351(-)
MPLLPPPASAYGSGSIGGGSRAGSRPATGRSMSGMVQAKRPMSAGRLSTISDAESEPEQYKVPPQDPVLAVMMKGPPLFSPMLCSRAAYYSL